MKYVLKMSHITYHDIEAETEEEAIKKMQDHFYEAWHKQVMTPERNSDLDAELFDENDESIADM